MAKWTAFPYAGEYVFDAASVRKYWARLHAGDAEPLPTDARVLQAWALFHSGEFQKAMDRWRASLEAERDALAEEKGRLESWRSELGVPDEKFYEHLIPFMGQAETPLQKIQQMDEKELYKLSRSKTTIAIFM